MGVVEENTTVRMIREDLLDIPQHELSPGFSFRWYRPGDEQSWVEIQQMADRYNTITEELFFREYGHDGEPMQRRICFLLDRTHRPIGTASAWFNDEYRGGRWARLHWVAIIPEMQGKGLAKPLMTVVTNRMAELGDKRAYLVTSTARVPAIHLYLNFGYRPEALSAEDELIWRRFSLETGLPTL